MDQLFAAVDEPVREPADGAFVHRLIAYSIAVYAVGFALAVWRRRRCGGQPSRLSLPSLCKSLWAWRPLSTTCRSATRCCIRATRCSCSPPRSGPSSAPSPAREIAPDASLPCRTPGFEPRCDATLNSGCFPGPFFGGRWGFSDLEVIPAAASPGVSHRARDFGADPAAAGTVYGIGRYFWRLPQVSGAPFVTPVNTFGAALCLSWAAFSIFKM